MLSVVIPIHNEEENIEPLYIELKQVLQSIPQPSEMLFVDDGSYDQSYYHLANLANRDPDVKIIRFRRNFGQTAALEAGIQLAQGEIIVTIDGDLQNDPADIPRMLEKMEEGYDLVHGWRKQRKDAWLSRKLPSRIANWLISRVTRFPVHDLGCTLKTIRREIAQELELYGEMHRFIPILAHRLGARCTEMVTHHRARRFGTTKYGISRTARVILDLATVKYLLDYSASPMKLFGGIGLCCAGLASVTGTSTLLMKWFGSVDMTGNPLLLLSALLVLVAVQFMSLGLLGEVTARIYFGSQGKRHYAIRDLTNITPELAPAKRSIPTTVGPTRRAA